MIIQFLKKNITKVIFFLFLIIFFIVGFKFKLFKYLTYENAEIVKQYILGLNFIGPILIIVLYILFNIALMPTFYFIFISSYLYGPFYGFLLGWFGMIIGLTSSFLSSRYIFRKDFTKKFGNTKIVKTLEDYIQKYHGWAVIFFRLFFVIPYNIQNPAYGLTSVKLYIYVLCSAIGILPTTILYIWLGHLVAENKIGIHDVRNVSLFLVVFITVFASIIFTSMLIKKKMKIQEKLK